MGSPASCGRDTHLSRSLRSAASRANARIVSGASRRIPKTLPKSARLANPPEAVHRRSLRARTVAPAGPAARFQGDLTSDKNLRACVHRAACSACEGMAAPRLKRAHWNRGAVQASTCGSANSERCKQDVTQHQ
eukprot:1191075-Pyramimonas_sp.AAC.1